MLNVKSIVEVLELINHRFGDLRMESHSIPLDEALGRALAQDIQATEYVPNFNRSTVDGYAVIAADVFGCSESIPALLNLVGESYMGQPIEIQLQKGQCVYVPTGAQLPANADAMVMLENAEDFHDGTIAIYKPAAPGANLMFVLVLATLMLPGQVTMIPAFIIFRSLGWYDTMLPLIVPSFFGSAVFIFLIRQFFMTLPVDLEDAARIDGCGTWTIYWRIMMPLATPALVTVALFAFVGAWNDFMGPLIYLNSLDKRTLALGLMSFTNAWGTDIVQVMAASAVITLPVLIVFFTFQRYFIQGVVTTGLKG